MPDSVDRHSLASLLESPDQSLLDLVDSLLDKGVVLDGEIVLGLADVDLVYLRLSVLLVAADRVLPP
jgi:Gas vesicle protein